MEKDHLSRKLAVILHADVVGSTSLVQKNEALAHERIQSVFQSFAKTIETYGGLARELRGDALVAEFERASDAVVAAIAFQAQNEKSNATLNDEIRPVLRIGISLGEVIIADNTITGAGVILAQRLEQIATPGSVIVQSSVYETVPTRIPLKFESLGEQSLKGFDNPVRAYVAELQPGSELPSAETDSFEKAGDETSPAARDHHSPVDINEKPSIAVLPFDNMSGDPEQEFFSDGITEDITTALSHFSGLFVIARNSSFSYKGHAVDIRQIASELGVRYVLEGSIRRSGNRIRINGQLINAETGNHIWAERFDGDLDEIFELQDEITRKIVGSIAPQIELAEVERGRGLQPASLSSYELSLQAKSQAYDAFRLGDVDKLENAIDIANEALKLDSRNTQALWMLGITQMELYLYQWGQDPAEALVRARQAAERLIHVDSSNAAGHVLRGSLRIFQREFDLAIADFEMSLSLNPNASLHLFFAAWGESLAGLTKLAREHAELGIKLSPREMDIWMGVAYLALLQASFAEEKFEDAIKWGRLSIQMHAKAPIRRTLMVACCAYTGNLEEAAHHADELKVFSPDFIPTILRGELLIYRNSAHNELLIEGIRKAGLHE
jgi:adenylate cyclase